VKLRNLIYYLFFASVFNSASGQDVTVNAVFDTTSIYIGDQIHYTVTVEQPSDVSLFIQPHRDTLSGKIEILSGPETDTSSIQDNRIKITNRYLITSFDTGFYQVPPSYAEIKNESGIKRFYSDYGLLEVVRLKITPADTAAKFFDIIKPYRAPVTFGEIIPWVLLAALAAALVWMIIRLLKRFRKTVRDEKEEINPDPAHIIAFRDLEKLKAAELWQKGEVKTYYSSLTEILRKYLENRFGVFSLEMTTSETLEELVKTGFKRDESYIMLKTILNGSDLVKFAKYKPDPAENELHFDNSWKFVNLTKAEDEPAAKNESDQKTEDVK